MPKLSKRQVAINAKIDRTKLYAVADALNLIKQTATAKFDESVDIAVNLGIDARKSDQLVRGSVVLPRGTGKTVRVAVFAQGDAAKAALEAGADIVAVDGTRRPRNGDPLAVLIRRIHDELGKPVMVDIATIAEAIAAEAEGCDYVGSTMAGYTPETAHRRDGPDLELLAELVAQCHRPVIAEGRYDTPALAAKALALGAHAVVVGTAITNPREITRRFVDAMAPG